MNSPTAIRVDVWSDVQCIWCYISSARLRTAIARHGGDVHVVRHSFQLSPEAPIDIDRDAHIRRHGADPERMRRILAHLNQLTAQEGLAYEPDSTQPTNSHRALRLLHHADASGARAVLEQRLFEAHFAEGRNIGHVDQLLAIAEQVGLDREEARGVLEGGRYTDAVAADIRQAQLLGARGVPFYVVDGIHRLSGAQDVEQFLAAFAGASAR